MNLTRWEPLGLTRWESLREIEDMLRSRYSPFFGRTPDAEQGVWAPAADISETDKEYVIKAQLPAVKKEDVKITLENDVITIAGERRQEKEEKSENEIRVESCYGRFSRSFSLPENVDAKAIRAESKDGVLRVYIPKAQMQQAKPVSIEVK